MKDGLKQNVGNGLEVRFWLDTWIPGLKALSTYEDVTIPPREINSSVASCIKSNGDWDLIQLKQWILENFIMKFRNTIPPIRDLGLDCVSWPFTSDGKLTL